MSGITSEEHWPTGGYTGPRSDDLRAHTPVGRREGQPVPASADEAAATFRCQAYVVTLSGRACAAQHASALANPRDSRDACVDCPAGIARAVLLSGQPVRMAKCAHRSMGGRPCNNNALVGLTICRMHRKSPQAAPVVTLTKADRQAKAKAHAIKRAEAKARAQVSEEDVPVPKCRRCDCEPAAARDGGPLAGLCARCVGAGRSGATKRGLRRDDDMAVLAWINDHPYGAGRWVKPK